MKESTIQKIRHYALQQELSHKAGRRTFLARDLYTKTPVIVKVLQLGSAFEWDALKLFQREAQILQHLDHPTIPQYKESFEAEIDGVHSFVLVQTYIPAPSLQKVVEAGKLFSEAETIAIAQRLLTTLSYLHQQLPPVIHRDIKPSNILISDPALREIVA
ncbi:MAG: protein kinase, partial [Phormidesmis sp.]